MNKEILKIALAVSNSKAGCLSHNISSSIELIKRAVSEGADIICFPELSVTGYYNNEVIKSWSLYSDSPELNAISDLSIKHGSVILVGFSEKKSETEVYATHSVFYPDGSRSFYRKLHIAPPESGIFSQGMEIPVFEFKGFKFGIQLCYDAHFPELTTIMSLKGADIIFFPHASPRGDSSKKMNSWLRHLTARSFDNGIYVAACNQCGNNGKGLEFPGVAVLISPDGLLEESLLTDKDDILIFDISKKNIEDFRSSRMKYFLPFRRKDLSDL